MKVGKIERGSPFSNDDIVTIKNQLGRDLPLAYQQFVAEWGNAFIAGLVDGKPDLPVLSFMSADRIAFTLANIDDFRAEHVLPFADCDLGNLWVLCTDGSIYYIDYYGGETKVRLVAEDFTDFVDRIVIDDE